MKDKSLFFITGGAVIFLLILVASVNASAFAPTTSCAIAPSITDRLQPDTDCDGVIDRLDNCPLITNPAQRDSNRNGLGDACDMHFESAGTNPSDFVFNGRAFNVAAVLVNNRDYNMRNTRVSVIIPDFGIESNQYIDHIDTCTSKGVEFSVRAPICAPEGEYPVFVEATFTNIFGDQEKTGTVTSIHLIPDDYCANLLAGNMPEMGNTYVDVMEIQDVYKGSEAVFPIKISNREESGNDYIISVTGLDGWGSSRVVPNSLIVVPAGTDRIVDLYVSAKDDIPPGERVFVVTITHSEESQRFLLIANVKEQMVEDRSAYFIFAFKMVLLVLLALLIIFAIFIGLAKLVSKARQDAREEYY